LPLDGLPAETAASDGGGLEPGVGHVCRTSASAAVERHRHRLDDLRSPDRVGITFDGRVTTPTTLTPGTCAVLISGGAEPLKENAGMVVTRGVTV
jgi:hypothetical protein